MNSIDTLAVLSSLVVGELARLRHCSARSTELAEISAATEIGGGDLGTDSLDLIHLATAVAQLFHLQETGTEEYLLRYRKLSDWAEIVTTSLRAKAERLTFRTSGSSGKPKACVHHVSDLLEEVSIHAAAYRNCRRVLTLVPRHHIYGFLWTVMLPATLGVEVVDVRLWPTAKLAGALQEGDLLVATPSLWRHVHEFVESFPSFLLGVTSGAVCPAALFRDLRAQGLELSEIYGSSETGGMGRRSSPDDPFQLFPFWRPAASPHSLERRSSEGGDRRQFEVPDELEWIDKFHFRVGQRRDEAVQVHGVNVFPHHVVEVLRKHPDVTDCAVRPMRTDEGERLKAFVVWRNEEDGPEFAAERRDELRVWMRQRLSPQEIPQSIAFGSELPRNAMGKLADWEQDD